MTENDPLRSGSRWEPQPGSDWAGTAVPDAAAAASEFLTTDRPSPRGRRGLLAGAGAGILLLGGVGGFAAGHALAGTRPGGDSPSVVQNGIPGRYGVPGDASGDGRFGPPGGFDRDDDHGAPGGDA